MYKVFVYGSLKKNFGNHGILKDSNFVGHAVTASSDFNMFSMGAFPGVTKEGDNTIVGEVYEVDDKVLQNLDWLEGNGSFYTREMVGVEIEDLDNTEAWMYLLPHGYPHRTGGSGVDVKGKFQEWTR